MTSEYLARAYFSKKGFTILNADTHETPYDFIIMDDEGKQKRVQVKSTVIVNGDLIRVRNKHGSTNKSYAISDYDILCGVYIEESMVYLFKSENVNENPNFGECLTVGTTTGRPLDKTKRLIPDVIERV